MRQTQVLVTVGALFMATASTAQVVEVACGPPSIDRTLEIQTAVNQAALGSHVVQLDACDYLVNIGRITLSDGITLRGRGRGVTTLVTTTGYFPGTTPIVVANATQTLIEDLGFKGAGAGYAGGSGVQYTNAPENTLQRVQITGFRVGVLYEGGDPALPSKSPLLPPVLGQAPFSSSHNYIHDSEIVDNVTNILAMNDTDFLTLAQVTFGGRPSEWGVRSVSSEEVGILRAHCIRPRANLYVLPNSACTSGVDSIWSLTRSDD